MIMRNTKIIIIPTIALSNIFNPINDNILNLSKSIIKTLLKHLQIMLEIACSFTLILVEMSVTTATSSPCIICIFS